MHTSWKGVFRLKEPFVNLAFVQDSFGLTGAFLGYKTLNDGHINSTFVLRFAEENGAQNAYVIQKINTFVFKDPDALMENILGVTSFLQRKIRARGGDPYRETLAFLPAKDGKYYARDDKGNCWRCYRHVDGVYTCSRVNDSAVFYNAGAAFGAFQNALADYPIEDLRETIPNFHNTYSRFLDLQRAIREDRVGRRAEVQSEIDFLLQREADTHVLLDLIEEGKLPLRVTHNDTKLNNILFDQKTNLGLCIIDLDTVMPGLALYDFGDSIRFGASTAEEDEPDISRVSLSLPLYRAYTEGYLHSAKKSLSPCEIEYLPFSAKLITLECGMRFLTDYLNNDVYFSVAYPQHNLVRCRAQLKLAWDMEKKMPEMQAITREALKA